jgi:taurine dioxygenase
MPYSTFDLKKLSPHVGAEISGLKLAKPLASDTIRELRHALSNFGFLGFRDQSLSVEEQIAFARQFGKLYIHPVADLKSKHPEILPVYADEKTTRVHGEWWHSDASSDIVPPLGSILQLQEMPDVGGDTAFASMYAAYDALSSSMKTLLAGLTAVHGQGRVYHRPGDYPTNEHPVICVHPESRRKVIFVNQQYTMKIVQFPPSESEAILNLLFRHIESPEFQCRFQWRPNSVVFWDNRCVQHKAIFDYFPHRRVGTRVQICGESIIPA